MDHKIRLGPIAVFLTVIAAVLATLAVLTVATSRADVTLAERFAAVTGIRYRLEAEGNRFLQEADAAAAAYRDETYGVPERAEADAQADAENAEADTQAAADVAGADAQADAEAAGAILAGLPDGTEILENGNLRYYSEEDGYALTIEATVDAPAGKCDVVTWKVTKIWTADDPFENLWKGW